MSTVWTSKHIDRLTYILGHSTSLEQADIPKIRDVIRGDFRRMAEQLGALAKEYGCDLQMGEIYQAQPFYFVEDGLDIRAEKNPALANPARTKDNSVKAETHFLYDWDKLQKHSFIAMACVITNPQQPSVQHKVTLMCVVKDGQIVNSTADLDNNVYADVEREHVQRADVMLKMRARLHYAYGDAA